MYFLLQQTKLLLKESFYIVAIKKEATLWPYSLSNTWIWPGSFWMKMFLCISLLHCPKWSVGQIFPPFSPCLLHFLISSRPFQYEYGLSFNSKSSYKSQFKARLYIEQIENIHKFLLARNALLTRLLLLLLLNLFSVIYYGIVWVSNEHWTGGKREKRQRVREHTEMPIRSCHT